MQIYINCVSILASTNYELSEQTCIKKRDNNCKYLYKLTL